MSSAAELSDEELKVIVKAKFHTLPAKLIAQREQLRRMREKLERCRGKLIRLKAVLEE